MESGAVVEGFDVIEDGGASSGKGGEAMMVDKLVFEAAPKRLNESIIVAVALASHRSKQPVLSNGLAVSSAGKLSPRSEGDDKVLRVSPLTDRHAQSDDGQGSIEQLAHGPADDVAREQIEDSNQL